MNFTWPFIVIVFVKNLERVLNNVRKNPKLSVVPKAKVLNVGTFQKFVYFKFQQHRECICRKEYSIN